MKTKIANGDGKTVSPLKVIICESILQIKIKSRKTKIKTKTVEIIHTHINKHTQSSITLNANELHTSYNSQY